MVALLPSRHTHCNAWASCFSFYVVPAAIYRRPDSTVLELPEGFDPQASNICGEFTGRVFEFDAEFNGISGVDQQPVTAHLHASTTLLMLL